MDLIQPRLISMFNWLTADVASIESTVFELGRIGYFCRSDSNFSTLVGSASHSVRSPLSMLSTINRILSTPYSPHANSTTAKIKQLWLSWRDFRLFCNFEVLLTVIGWIVILWTWQLYWLQIWHNFIGTSLIQALAQRKHVHLLELLEKSCRRLMNCTNYGASLTC